MYICVCVCLHLFACVCLPMDKIFFQRAIVIYPLLIYYSVNSYYCNNVCCCLDIYDRWIQEGVSACGM